MDGVAVLRPAVGAARGRPPAPPRRTVGPAWQRRPRLIARGAPGRGGPGRSRDRGTGSRGGGEPAGPAGGPGAAPRRRADLGRIRRLSRDRAAAPRRALPRPYVLAALRRFARPAVA